MRLPITEGLILGESLHGCLMRHAEQNMYDNLSWIIELATAETFEQWQMAGLSQHTPALSALLDIPEAQLRAVGYVKADVQGCTLSGFGDQVFSRPLLDFVNAGVCPQCLSESGHIRQVWDLGLLVACPHHGKLLLRVCPDCGRKLKWRRSAVCFCDCGCDLRSAETLDVPEPTRHLMELIYVATGECSATENLGFPGLPMLRTLSLEQISDLVLFVARWLRSGKTINVLSLPRMTIQDRIDLCTDVANVFQTWPDGWRAAIADFGTRRVQKNDRLFGLQKIFGGLYVKLFYRSEPQFSMLREEFLRVVSVGEMALMCSVGRNHVAFGERLTENKYVPAQEARDIMGIGLRTFDWLKEIGKLEIQTRQIGRKVVHLISRENVAAAKDYLDSLMPLAQVSQRLGITVSMVERLTKGGALPAVRGKSVDGYRNWLFERTEVEDFRRQLNRAAKRPFKKETDRLIPLTAAIMGVRTFGVQAAQVLNAIFESRLRAFKVGDTVKKLDDVLIGHREVMAFARSLASPPPYHQAPTPA